MKCAPAWPAKLEGITNDLTRTAGEMRQATDVLTKASQLIDRATGAVGVITGLLV